MSCINYSSVCAPTLSLSQGILIAVGVWRLVVTEWVVPSEGHSLVDMFLFNQRRYLRFHVAVQGSTLVVVVLPHGCFL